MNVGAFATPPCQWRINRAHTRKHALSLFYNSNLYWHLGMGALRSHMTEPPRLNVPRDDDPTTLMVPKRLDAVGYSRTSDPSRNDNEREQR